MNQVEIAAIITGLVQVFKYYKFPKSLCPLLSVILGPVITVGKAYSDLGGIPETNMLVAAIISGVAIGVATTGTVGLLQQTAKNVTKNS